MCSLLTREAHTTRRSRHHARSAHHVPRAEHIVPKTKSTSFEVLSFLVAGVGLEPHDLRVMSPTSYHLLHPAIFSCMRADQHGFTDWCRKPGSNRYDTHVSRDFKSRASANSAIPACKTLVFRNCLYIITPKFGFVKPFSVFCSYFSFYFCRSPRHAAFPPALFYAPSRRIMQKLFLLYYAKLFLFA